MANLTTGFRWNCKVTRNPRSCGSRTACDCTRRRATRCRTAARSPRSRSPASAPTTPDTTRCSPRTRPVASFPRPTWPSNLLAPQRLLHSSAAPAPSATETSNAARVPSNCLFKKYIFPFYQSLRKARCRTSSFRSNGFNLPINIDKEGNKNMNLLLINF